MTRVAGFLVGLAILAGLVMYGLRQRDERVRAEARHAFVTDSMQRALSTLRERVALADSMAWEARIALDSIRVDAAQRIRAARMEEREIETHVAAAGATLDATLDSIARVLPGPLADSAITQLSVERDEWESFVDNLHAQIEDYALLVAASDSMMLVLEQQVLARDSLIIALEAGNAGLEEENRILLRQADPPWYIVATRALPYALGLAGAIELGVVLLTR